MDDERALTALLICVTAIATWFANSRVRSISRKIIDLQAIELEELREQLDRSEDARNGLEYELVEYKEWPTE